MKLSILVNLALAGGHAVAAVPSERTDTTRGTSLKTRQTTCHAGELLLFKNGNQFLCLGRNLVWPGLALNAVSVKTSSAAARQFANWVINKTVGEPSATVGKRDISEKPAEKWFEDEETVTYGWKPSTHAVRDEASLHIYNMTATYDKSTRFMTQAEITFDGEQDSTSDSSLITRERRTAITITYYAVLGHEGTILQYNDIFNLFHQIFISSPDEVGSECGWASNTGAWHGAFKATVFGAPDAGGCYAEREA
ncbi:hypothetical protein NUW58_g554 [Xylaria curta]|uniref:Uncharacterized protein n=1 Tax=Xylaria curta TaxID=42375 RepID=A0ACC1PRK8_9PEZI|nr:hypothetical protein NUW58_g554 [Xylaria curta]